MKTCARCGNASFARLCLICGAMPPKGTFHPVAEAAELDAQAAGSVGGVAASRTARIRRHRAGTPHAPRQTDYAGSDGAPGADVAVRRHGRVVSAPTVVGGGRPWARFLRRCALPLFVLVLVTNPAVIMDLIIFGLLLLFVIWILRRIGLGGISPSWLGLPLLRRGRPQAIPTQIGTLVFRYLDGSATRSVHLPGHETGVQLGDMVEVHGVSVNGTIRALRVRNISTGATLRPPGLVLSTLVGFIDVILLWTLIAQVTGR